MIISGWGRHPRVICKVVKPKNIQEIKRSMKFKCIARGNGRSYGDCSLQPKLTIDTKNFKEILKFDKKKGIVVVQPGILLKDLLKFIVAEGWFVPVTPGTKFVTIGGMVAANVHGKNHHNDGGIINFLNYIKVLNHKKEMILCSKNKNKKLFYASVGGMGLTGIITEVSLKLKKIYNSYIDQEIQIETSIENLLKLLKKKSKKNYSVAWVDLANFSSSKVNSITYFGDHSKNPNFKLKVFENKFSKLPNLFNYLISMIVINSLVLKIFNFIYFVKNKYFFKESTINYNKFFYPLDGLKNWNLLYGSKGMIQYQFILPERLSLKGLKKIISFIKNNKMYSYLTTLKFMKKDPGNLSFPIKGFSMTLDFPVSEKNLNLVKHLDKITEEFKGRIYLAKDARMSRDFINKQYNIKKFSNFRAKIKKENYFSSIQSERLKI